MFKSIRNILYLSFIFVGIALFFIIILGVRQYQLTTRYSETTALSERALFGFSTIREQAAEYLIAGEYGQLKSLVPEIEQLNNNVSQLYDSGVIPAEYKLAMADKIDLAGLVIDIRKLESAPDRISLGISLQREFRQISDSLIKVDRIITNQIRDAVVNFQMSMIGALGVLMSCASFILIILYRKAVNPLLDLTRQAAEPGVERIGFDCPPDASDEIIRFVDSANRIFAQLPGGEGTGPEMQAHDLELLSNAINESTNGLNGIINYAQLLLETTDQDQLPEEQRNMLEQIIESSERLAAQWQQVSQRTGG